MIERSRIDKLLRDMSRVCGWSVALSCSSLVALDTSLGTTLSSSSNLAFQSSHADLLFCTQTNTRIVDMADNENSSGGKITFTEGESSLLTAIMANLTSDIQASHSRSYCA